MKGQIRDIFLRRDKKGILKKDLSPAAVLLLLFRKEGEYHILFTERTNTVKTHKGEVSFPGGASLSEDETPVSTALRECFEEIGVKEKDIEILGELDDVKTVTSHYVITPFVATFPYPYFFKLSKDEVNKIIEVPLLSLLDQDRFSEGTWIYENRSYSTYFYRYREYTIWGATAIILKQFIAIVSSLPQFEKPGDDVVKRKKSY